MALSLDAKMKVRALVKTKDGEDNGTISPDGHWLAYQSNESGNRDIYVRPMLDIEVHSSTMSREGRAFLDAQADGRSHDRRDHDNEHRCRAELVRRREAAAASLGPGREDLVE